MKRHSAAIINGHEILQKLISYFYTYTCHFCSLHGNVKMLKKLAKQVKTCNLETLNNFIFKNQKKIQYVIYDPIHPNPNLRGEIQKNLRKWNTLLPYYPTDN